MKWTGSLLPLEKVTANAVGRGQNTFATWLPPSDEGGVGVADGGRDTSCRT